MNARILVASFALAVSMAPALMAAISSNEVLPVRQSTKSGGDTVPPAASGCVWVVE